MKNVKPIWKPQYRVTTDMVRCLMDIETIRTTVGQTALTTAVEAKLRRQARLHSTHYSTRIEGNRLTLAEAEQAIQGRRVGFQGRERDVLEVQVLLGRPAQGGGVGCNKTSPDGEPDPPASRMGGTRSPEPADAFPGWSERDP